MKLTSYIMKGIKYILPSPFTIGIILTFIALALAFFFTGSKEVSSFTNLINILDFWNKGFWELLEFSMQMVLMLLLGHVIAISKPVEYIINKILTIITSASLAVFFITLFTIIVGFINWGLGLIFGAIMARKIAEKFKIENKPLNYPLVAASGYVGLMVWHGGLSGSAPLKVADSTHFLVDKIGVISSQQTIFSTMNLVCIILLIVVVPLVMFFVSKYQKKDYIDIQFEKQNINWDEKIEGAEKLDYSKIVGSFIGIVIIFFSFYKMFLQNSNSGFLNLINTNFINTVLFGFALLFHRSINSFLNACNEAIAGTLGIVIQFPIYAGIMGIMKYSGLTILFSEFFISISTQNSLPIYTLISAGLVNIFVPSGGGQWAVQGEIIVNAAQALHSSIPKNIMALAYGDQLTNMLQPFWALPLLGITKLKAQQIFPYTLILFLIGLSIFTLVLLIF